jgi:uncharacterized cupin superfamily protein
MNKINLMEVSIERGGSPKGRFRRLSQDISRALTGSNGLGKSGLAQPFEVELVRLPAGAINWPYHSHTAQWEVYLIIAGRGQVRTPEGTAGLREGDCLVHPPSEPHQIINTGATDLVYYVMANNPPSDVCYYPDTNKWSLPGLPNPVRVQPSDYYDGEE